MSVRSSLRPVGPCLLIATLGFAACGSDETMARPWDADSTEDPQPGVDVCRALRSMFQVPGVLEGLCALRQPTEPVEASAGECLLCAASGTLLERVWPESECYVELNDCPVGDEELSGCFETVGSILADSLPRCGGRGANEGVDADTLVLQIATSTCAGVITRCQPLQQWILDVVSDMSR